MYMQFHVRTSIYQVVGIISAATAGFGLLKGIAEQIDLSRVCVIGLSNNGNRKLTEPTWYLDSGIIKNPLPRVIPAGEAGIFTFEKTNCEFKSTNYGFFQFSRRYKTLQLLCEKFSLILFIRTMHYKQRTSILESPCPPKPRLNYLCSQ